MYYEIIAEYNICGKLRDCLATHDNKAAIFFTQEEAEQRLAEVQAQGYKAHIETEKRGSAWWDDDNWIG